MGKHQRKALPSLQRVREVRRDHGGEAHGQSLPVRGEQLGLSSAQTPMSPREKGLLAQRCSLLRHLTVG